VQSFNELMRFSKVPEFSSWASGLIGNKWMDVTGRGSQGLPAFKSNRSSRIASRQLLSGSFLSQILVSWPPTQVGHSYFSGVEETAQKLVL
jgi:hypothetical protein